MRRYLTVVSLGAALLAPSGAYAFVASSAPNTVQRQPAPGSCHMQGSYPFNRPDPHCTPGATNPQVTQATINRTICVVGWTRTVRPPESVAEREKLPSMRAYGLHQSPSHYEYDHVISLELGGARNDRRNLWPEPGASPNKKDAVENYLHRQVCNGQMSLARAQSIIAGDWVTYYNAVVSQPKPKPPVEPPPPPPPSKPTPPDEGLVHPGSFCSPPGAMGHSSTGLPEVCGPASDGRDRWHHS